MIITLAFYKEQGDFGDKIIRWWTKSPYSHVEMILGDNWISSNQKYGGVTINPLQPLNDSWEYVSVKVDGRKLTKVMNFIADNKDAKYDWLGLFFGNVFNSKIEDTNKFFCSEMMVLILQLFEVEQVKYITASQTDPGEVYRLFK